MSIRNKLIITLLIFSFIPFLSLGLFEITKDRKTLTEQIGNDSLELSRLLMRYIDEYLYSKYINIQGWTKTKCLNDITSGDEYGNISQFLAGMAKIHDEYYYINCLNTNGQVVASSNIDLKGRDMSTDAGFKEALNGNQTMQDVTFKEAAGGYAIVMSTPVWDIPEQSEIIGVLTVALKWDIVNGMITGLKIGGKEQTEANHIMLLNKDGMAISCFDKEEIFSNNLIEAGMKSAKHAQEHKEGYLTETSEHGLSSFATYTYSKKCKDLPHLDWILILEQDPKIVFAVIGSSKKTMIITLLGTSALLIIVSFMFASRVSKPILAIVSATRAIGKGDLNTKVPVKSNDEIGLLSTSFNEMVDDLQNSNSALYKSEEKYRKLMETAQDAILCDINGIITDWNKSAEELFGYSKDEIIGKSVNILVPEKYKKEHQEGLERFLKTGERRMIGRTMEVSGITKEGAEIPIEISLTVQKLGNERYFFMAIIRDLSEKTKLQAEIIRTGQLALIGELAAGLAHEINNPINGIINYAQLIVDESDNDSRALEFGGFIMEEGNRIADLTKNLLSLSRSTTDKKEPVQIYELFSNSLKLTKVQLKKDNIIIKDNIPKDIPAIIANPQEIHQVFLNLIHNARYALNEKYPGKDKDKIFEVSCNEVLIDDYQYVRLIFYDRGIGISENILSKVANPFFTTKPPARGSGIGLSISQNIINNHNGKMTIESRQGEFTKIVIDLPVAELTTKK